FHELGLSQYLKMLGGIRHGLAGLPGKVFHGTLGLSEKLDQFQAATARKRFPDSGELLEQLVLEFAFCGRLHIQLFNLIIEYCQDRPRAERARAVTRGWLLCHSQSPLRREGPPKRQPPRL